MKNFKKLVMSNTFNDDVTSTAREANSGGSQLNDHPPSEALAGQFLLYDDFDIPKTTELVNLLAVENVRVTHQAKVLEERCTERDTSYDSPMKLEELPDAWRQSWTAALNRGATAEAATAFAASAKLRLNPFIPEDLDMKAQRILRVRQKMELRPLARGRPVTESDAAPASPWGAEGTDKLGQVQVVNYVFHRQDDVSLGLLKGSWDLVTRVHAAEGVVYDLSQNPSKRPVKTGRFSAGIAVVATGARGLLDSPRTTSDQALSEFSYDAEIASGTWHASGVVARVRAGGFHDKLGVLIEEEALSLLREAVYKVKGRCKWKAQKNESAVAAKMLEIGTDSIADIIYELCSDEHAYFESVPENFYNLVADRMADALKNQAGFAALWLSNLETLIAAERSQRKAPKRSVWTQRLRQQEPTAKGTDDTKGPKTASRRFTELTRRGAVFPVEALQSG
ncbi:hypothetical protein AK812_SmicGene41199 [Symbiodinium microadriaticum]|uniref:Peptidase M16 middle/third domain-containing protein n=1 Tax=Symbiodinium microadriaticum TaxID=2951 RepID=A0A1Q9C6Q7_SYMMI|nr:hypothetical protein AK812_SmicGene41199 [Symbiodinium microadriaticum]